ncbi:MAG TPA: glycosyltransferase family A protein [Polyangiaceae bacterium]|nr:glycosyltransferase family A protein [Polyangiaceae bacterium]
MNWNMALDERPLVSIIIPAYVATARQSALLDETLGTVNQQSYTNYEVIVVDDGSPLELASVVARHPRACTLRRKNAGSALARNTGIEASRGSYLVFLDADDHLLPAALERGLRAFGEHPECGFVVGRREEMTYEGGPVAWGVPASPGSARLYNTLLAFDWYIIPPSSAMFRRAVVQTVGGFRDPWGADDLDFYLRVARASFGFCYDDTAVTRYRRYSASSSRDGERMLRSVRAVYARQWPLIQGDREAEAAYRKGLAELTRILTACLLENVRDRARAGQWRKALRSSALLTMEIARRTAADGVRALRPTTAQSST